MITKIRSSFLAAFAALTCASLVACAGIDWPAVGSDVLNLVSQGGATAQEAYNGYNAVNQALTTANVTHGKLTVDKVVAAYSAGNAALNTPGFQASVKAFLSDANLLIADLKSKGASTPAIINAVAQQGASTVTTLTAVPFTPNATSPAVVNPPANGGNP